MTQNLPKSTQTYWTGQFHNLVNISRSISLHKMWFININLVNLNIKRVNSIIWVIIRIYRILNMYFIYDFTSYIGTSTAQENTECFSLVYRIISDIICKDKFNLGPLQTISGENMPDTFRYILVHFGYISEYEFLSIFIYSWTLIFCNSWHFDPLISPSEVWVDLLKFWASLT